MDRKIEKKKFLIPTKYWPWAVGGTVILALLAWLATGSYTSVLKVERESLIISPVIKGEFNDYIALHGHVAPIQVVQVSLTLAMQRRVAAYYETGQIYNEAYGQKD